MTRQEIVHELLAARELLKSMQYTECDKILKRVEEGLYLLRTLMHAQVDRAAELAARNEVI